MEIILRNTLLLAVPLFVCTCANANTPNHDQFSVGMSRAEIVEKFGNPERTQVFYKSSNHVWGPIEEFWNEVPQGGKVEIWRFPSTAKFQDSSGEYAQRGETELYFVNDAENVSGIGFHMQRAVYESS